MEKEKNELQSRRDFFKKAAGIAIPVIALATFPTIFSSCEEMDDTYKDLTGSGSSGSGGGCSACSGGCGSNCASACRAAASYTPSGCNGTCKSACSSTCKSLCMGTSKSGYY